MLAKASGVDDIYSHLIETSTEIIDSIWTNATEPPSSPYQQSKIKVVSTRDFIREILRRSKTTYSNLQVCLFYLFRVKKAVLIHLEKMELQHETKSMEDNMISCGRRMFLASLMVAAKFLQDKNYRNRAWSRLSGLALSEINAAEITFLKLINYNLYISKPSFDRWFSLLHSYLYRQPSQQQPHHQVSFYQTQPCLTCYNMTHRPDTPTCMMCYYIQCNDGSPCFSSSLHHPYDQRSPSFSLAYPSPPSDDLNSAPWTPPRDPHQRRNKRRTMMDDDGDQDPFNIKRSCFDIQ